MSATLRVPKSRAIGSISLVFLGLGLVARVLPLFDYGGRLLRQFPTEDGYLMMTLARNLALGNGMSTAEGTLPSNGTQPLATLLYALVYLAVSGDKVAGVAGVLLLQLLIALASAYALFRLARHIMRDRPDAEGRAALAATGWFASPQVVSHSMNCLETGLYGLCLMGFLLAVLDDSRSESGLQLKRWGLLGGLLGVAFWARNDAVLVCATLATVHLTWGLPGAPKTLQQRFLQLSLAGALVVVIASPWLLYNHFWFGSVVPISGQSEGMDAKFAENLGIAFPNLLEYLFMPLMIPHSVEGKAGVVAGSLVALLSAAFFIYRRTRHAAPVVLAAARFGLIMAGLFIAFYGLYFGAGHFMSRYMFALSPLCAVAWGEALYEASARVAERTRGLGWVGTWALFVGVPAALLARNYAKGDQHMHFQVVDWVRENVGEDIWVGAIQSGTLGYFHDRTINLDGKVNPLALEARKQDRLQEYVAESEIQHLADWNGITAWMSIPPIASNFELTISDDALNLGVLKRRAAGVLEEGDGAEMVGTGSVSGTP